MNKLTKTLTSLALTSVIFGTSGCSTIPNKKDYIRASEIANHIEEKVKSNASKRYPYRYEKELKLDKDTTLIIKSFAENRFYLEIENKDMGRPSRDWNSNGDIRERNGPQYLFYDWSPSDKFQRRLNEIDDDRQKAYKNLLKDTHEKIFQN